MKAYFADIFYWIAFINPADDWHQRVRKTFRTLQPCRIITTDEILTELLTFYSKSGHLLLSRAATFVRDILESSEVDVIQQNRQSFLDELHLYEQRLDKGYSIPDCISMNTMSQLGIAEALTHDKHFVQEGFSIVFSEK